MQIDIIGSAYTTRSGSEDFETCVNFYIEKTMKGVSAKYNEVLYPTPGLTELVQLSGLVVRASLEFDGVYYCVCDLKFYKVVGAVATQKGTMVLPYVTSNPIIVTNGLQICVVDGGRGYVYDIAADTFVQITDPNFTAARPTYITFQDGYGIYNQPGTSTWWFTSINDFTVTDPLDHAAANTTNQDIVALISNRQQLYIFTPVGCEVWFNSGDPVETWVRKNTSYITQGLAAAASVCAIDNTLYYLTRSSQGDGFVVKIEGDSSPVIVSTPAISSILADFTVLSDCIGFSYQDEGHLFYVLIFPTEDRTLVYDIGENAWHERKSTLTNDPGAGTRQGRWRANNHAFVGDSHIVGDFQNGKLYVMDNDVYTENAVTIVRERTTSHLWNDLKRITLRSITLDCEVGVGNNSFPNPAINLYISKDGGYTYGNAHIGSLGNTGEYRKRIKFNRLGTARDFVGKIVVTDPVKICVLGASAELEMRDS